MWNKIKEISAILGGVLVVTAIAYFLIALFLGGNLALTKIFSPAQEQVRREVFEQSKAYRQGSIQELRSMQFDYLQADDAHKIGLASVIRHRAADIPQEVLPPDLSMFIRSLP